VDRSPDQAREADDTPAEVAAVEPSKPPQPSDRRWWRLGRADVAELAAVGLMVLWVAWPFLGTNGYPTTVDTITYSGPNHVVNLAAWRAWRVATWNPYMFGGIPHLANEQAGAASPIKLLALPFGAARGIGLLVAIHLVVLAIGLWLLARRSLRLAVPTGFVASTVGVAGGVVMVKSLQFEQVLVLAWAPLLMFAIDRLLDEGRPPLRAMAAVAALTALTILGGHPQLVYVVVPVVLVWTVARTVDRGAFHRFVALGVALAVGVLITSIQIIPTLSLTERSAFTSGRTLDQLDDPRLVLDRHVLPRALLGDVTSARPATLGGAFEASAFVGAAAAALALVGLVVSLRRGPRWTAGGLGLTALAGVVLALGPALPVYRWSAAVVPGFDLARVPARWLVAFALAVPILAALGTEAIVRRTVTRIDAVVSAAVVLAFGALVAVGVLGRPSLGLLAVWALTALLVVAAGGLVTAPGHWVAVGIVLPALVVGVELGAPSARSEARLVRQPFAFETFESNASRYLEGQPGKVLSLAFDRFDQPAYLAGTFKPNASALYGLRSLDGYDGGLQVTKRWVAMADTFSAAPFNRDLPMRNQMTVPLDAEHLARLGVRWVLVETEVLTAAQQVPGWRGPLAVDGTVQLYENPAYEGEATLRFSSIEAGTTEEAATLAASNPSAAVVEPGGPRLECATACTPVGVELERRGNDDTRVTTASDRPALLVLSDQYDPGWSATVDGKAVDIVPVDGFAIGVPIAAGAHDIALRYEPPHWALARLLSLLGVLALAVLLCWPLARRLRHPSQPDGPAAVPEEAGQDLGEQGRLEEREPVVPQLDLEGRVVRQEGP
jgi:hypothetical protein